jgi:3'-5' exoribonuclease
MKGQRTYISELKAGAAIDQVFFVAQKELRTARSGDFYITLTLSDKTGLLPARMWQANEPLYASIPLDGFLQVKGRVEEYKGSPQIVVDACRPIAPEKVDAADYVAVTRNDVEAMWAELLESLRAVKDRHLRMLIKKFVEDRDMVAGFKRSPAAMNLHHPFVGGLLEHTLNVVRSCQRLLPLYPKLNADLVLTGAFLHDIGKIAELQTGTALTYTDRGQLVGHITIAAIWIQEKAARISDEAGEPFPRALVDLLQHIVLSHHGQYEFGSPKLPMIPESFFIHYLDNLDAKMFMTVRDIEADGDPRNSFTGYNKDLQTRLFKRSGPSRTPEEQGPTLFE